MLSLTLLDFQAALPFSTHIEEANVRPFIDQAWLLDIVPVLDYAVLEAVLALDNITPKGYAEVTAIAEGDYVVRRERVYRALGVPITLPPTESASTSEWAYEPLHTLWTQYLKAYWLHAAFDRFAPQHGLNATKAGWTVPTDPKGTFTQPSAAARAALQASIDTTTEALRTRLLAFARAETLAYGKDATTGYDYGRAFANCHAAAPSSRPGRLRGINTTRPFRRRP